MGAQVIITIYRHFLFPLLKKKNTNPSEKYTLFLEPPAPPAPCHARYVEHMQ
jgi:hypothetical protein